MMPYILAFCHPFLYKIVHGVEPQPAVDGVVVPPLLKFPGRAPPGPGPTPRSVMLLLRILRLSLFVPLPIRKTPAPSWTCCPAGQALIAACICGVSDRPPPSGVRVGPHCVGRAGMPPL